MLFYDINTYNLIISLFMINSKKYKLCDMINHYFYYYFYYYYYYYHTTITYIATAITSIATIYITSSTTILLQLLLMQLRLLLLFFLSYIYPLYHLYMEGDNCCGCNHSALSLLTKELGDIEIIFASFYNDTLQKV